MQFKCPIQIPGFRPGKNIPESILINYVGKENVQKATIESILKRTLPHALSSVCLLSACYHLFCQHLRFAETVFLFC